MNFGGTMNIKRNFGGFSLLFLSLLSLGVSSPIDQFKAPLIKEEGYYNAAYYDSLGNKTIGVGHKCLPNENLIWISNSEVNDIFEKDLNKAYESAKKLVPSFNSHPEDVQIVIISMCFNLGHNGFYKFERFRAALAKRNYKSAALEIQNSKWATQVPKRAERAIKILNKY